jgi:hypothetical protein
MPGIELEKAKIDKHAMPWFDHNLDRDNIILRSDGRTEGLRETFTVIKLFYLKEREMLKALMEVLKEDKENERKTWLIPRSQILSMTRGGEKDELGGE